MRAHIDGLRSSDPTTLSVIMQDLLRRSINRIDHRSLCDLLALSESEALPKPMLRDLGRYRDQMVREFQDLPDGEKLLEFLAEMKALEPGRIPACWRETLLARIEDPRISDAGREALEALADRFADTPPDPIEVKEKAVIKVKRTTAPASHRPPSERPAKRTGTRRTAKKAPKSDVDTRREQWVKEDVLERLSHYPDAGLKQAVIVAGSRHRSPWDDLSQDEILSVLRALARTGKVKHSAGRWSLKGRW